MSDDLVKQSIAELQDLVRCRCHPAYKDRKLHDPDCECDNAENVKVVADWIERLEANIDLKADFIDGTMNQLAASDQRIEELEAKLATCEKYKAAYAECDRIGTQAVRDLEAKLAMAVGFIEDLTGCEWPYNVQAKRTLESLQGDKT